MKQLLGTIAIALALTGCATERSAYHPETWYAKPPVDIGKIAAVNQWAEQRGARVMWVNYPQKPRDSAGD